jgi:hypothetical protein
MKAAYGENNGVISGVSAAAGRKNGGVIEAKMAGNKSIIKSNKSGMAIRKKRVAAAAWRSNGVEAWRRENQWRRGGESISVAKSAAAQQRMASASAKASISG